MKLALKILTVVAAIAAAFWITSLPPTFQTSGMAIGSTIEDNPAGWAQHDYTFVQANYAMDDEASSMLPEIHDRNPEHRLVFHHHFWAVPLYLKRSYDAGARSWRARSWEAVAVNGDFLMRTNGIDPATGQPDTVSIWKRDPVVDITQADARQAIIKHAVDAFRGTYYQERKGAIFMMDFVTRNIPDFKVWQDPAYAANQIGLPDIDQDGVAFADDRAFYGDPDTSERDAWIQGQETLIARLRRALEDVPVIANGPDAVKESLPFVKQLDGVMIENFPHWYWGAGNATDWLGANDPDHEDSLGRIADKPYRTDRGGPYIFVENDAESETQRYAVAAACLLHDRAICVYRSPNGRELVTPAVDLKNLGRPIKDPTYEIETDDDGNRTITWHRRFFRGQVWLKVTDRQRGWYAYKIEHPNGTMESPTWSGARGGTELASAGSWFAPGMAEGLSRYNRRWIGAEYGSPPRPTIRNIEEEIFMREVFGEPDEQPVEPPPTPPPPAAGEEDAAG